MKKMLLPLLLATLPFGFIARAETEGPAASSDLRTPALTKSVTPEYPKAARQQGIEGSVLVECLVAPDGTVLAVGTLDKDQPLLAKAALDAVKQWQFASREASTQSPFVVKVPINFALEANPAQLDVMNIAAR